MPGEWVWAAADEVLDDGAGVGGGRPGDADLAGADAGDGPVGLVLFFTGALAAHVRARAFHNIAFPGGYFALAVTAAALAVAR